MIFCRLVALNREEASVVVFRMVAFTSGNATRVVLTRDEAGNVALLAKAEAFVKASSAGLAVMDKGRLVKAGQRVGTEHEHDVMTDGSSSEKVAAAVAPATQQLAVLWLTPHMEKGGRQQLLL